VNSRYDGVSRTPHRTHGGGLGLLAAALLSACTFQPSRVEEALTVPEVSELAKVVMVDETAMLPLLGYYQRVYRMSPQELVRERNVLAMIPQTPSVQVRMAMLLGQPRGPMDIVRALRLLDGVLKSSEPAAASVHPVARALASQYTERLRLEMQNEKLAQQLKESQRRSSELQEKLDALADIERSLPVRPTAGENLPGAPR
jgi:hypothetical protein